MVGLFGLRTVYGVQYTWISLKLSKVSHGTLLQRLASFGVRV